MKGTIKQRSEGSWTLIYDLPRGDDGKRRQKNVTIKGTKAEAQRELRKRLADVDQGLVTEGTSRTVADHMERWLTRLKHEVTPATLQGYELNVRTHILPHLGRIKLDALKPTDVDRFIQTLRTSGSQKAGRKGEGLAGTTVRHVGSNLRQALEVAVNLGLIARNPAKQVKLPKGRPEEKRIVNEDEVTRIMEHVRNSYLYPMILLGISTGMRRGEILALRWENVNMDTGEITICEAVQEAGGKLIWKDPKTYAGKRKVVLPEFALRGLVAHKARQSAHRLEVGPIWEDRDLVVCGLDGSPVRPSTASTRMTQAMNAMGMHKVTLHGLRHSFASIALAQPDVNIKTLQVILGHTNIAVTLGTYSHLIGGEQERVATRMNEALGKVVGL